MINLYGLLASLDGNQPDSSHIQTLLAISAQDDMASVYARNILNSLGEMQYEEPVLMPDLLKSSKAMEEYNTLIGIQTIQRINVVPNPAKDYIIIEYELESIGTGQIGIIDVTGKTIFSVQTPNSKDQVTIDTRVWKPGVYIATLKSEGKVIESIKFTITD
ncbi:MAG: T9SS type A sorting domain-containing protein [Bacteroidetes bacterium]|nr:T9SS type A sorting domain-containing protein [Bacteroidota bacterium]